MIQKHHPKRKKNGRKTQVYYFKSIGYLTLHTSTYVRQRGLIHCKTTKTKFRSLILKLIYDVNFLSVRNKNHKSQPEKN